MRAYVFFSLLFSLLFVSQSFSQWWVQGGNLLWPHGDVEISNDLTVGGTVNGVKKYVALLTQEGTDAPVATVLENSLGFEVVWERPMFLGEGNYYAVFPESLKVFILPPLNVWRIYSPNPPYYIDFSVSIDYFSELQKVQINTSREIGITKHDNVLYNYPVEIRVYP